ncbi:MAG: hypothetical protein ACRC6V_14400 [Bacteroidales bacterium]
MRKPRRKKIQPVAKIWEMDVAAIQAVIDHVKPKYPDSAQLVRYEKELKRREDNQPIEEFKDE